MALTRAVNHAATAEGVSSSLIQDISRMQLSTHGVQSLPTLGGSSLWEQKGCGVQEAEQKPMTLDQKPSHP